mgnify:CR=1 FL=1
MIRNAVPRSIWMSIGENDPLVPARGQKLSIPIVQKLLNIDSEKGDTKGEITTYKGIGGTELVTEIRDAGHEFPVASIPKMVEFFKRNVKGGSGNDRSSSQNQRAQKSRSPVRCRSGF